MPQSTAGAFLDRPSRIPLCLNFSRQPTANNSFKSVNLLVKGQGVLVFKLNTNSSIHIKFNIVVDNSEKKICENAAEVNFFVEGKDATMCSCTRLEMTRKDTKPFCKAYPKVFVDEEPEANYWISLLCVPAGVDGDKSGVFFKYGVGEVRNKLAQVDEFLILKNPDKKSIISPTIHTVMLSENVDLVRYLRDPVVTDTPMNVVTTDEFTIKDADKGTCCVPASLTPVCQKLYNHVSGENFVLNTPDFKDFTRAIEHSIKDPKGWCYKTLKNKVSEFGSFQETYLRITVGRYHGESPGIPYVVEIWPPGHYSPIHNHANANAIIRVLYGGIHVSLYPMLSDYHTKPFLETDFYEEDVTWISPTLNQTHKLHNINTDGPTCITIQCYMYDAGDNVHYEYFDYEDGHEIDQFLPTSDADYLVFKETIKQEWEQHKESVKKALTGNVPVDAEKEKCDAAVSVDCSKTSL
eukprot:g5120.t1